MPELPEVETIKLQLEKFIVGSTMCSIEIRSPKYEILNKTKIINSKIINIRRFAKILSIDLDNDFSVMIHVKLTGQLIYRGEKLKSDKLSNKVIGGLGGKHTHLIFHLNNGDLYYNDVRKFGWIKIIKSEELRSDNFINKLGPEPQVTKDFSGEVLTLDLFRQILSKTKRPIKIVLMDQTKIGGVGNIYATDALWLAKVNPKTPANSLSDQVTKLLFDSILTVLKAGLKYGGASELTFVTPEGREGEYQNHTLAYDHTGEPCERPACRQAGATFEKYFLGGRGTYWCPVCQK